MLLPAALLALAAPVAYADDAIIPEASDAPAPEAERPTRRPPPGSDRPDRKYRGARGDGGPEGGPEGPPPDGGKRGHPDSPLHPYALLQLWGTAYDMDVSAQGDATGYGDPEDDIGVKIKRARVGLVFEHQGLDARLIAGISAPYDGLDTRNGSFGLYAAEVGYHKSGLGVVAGLTEVPFSRDEMMASADLTFQEHGLAQEHIAPYRALGVLGEFERSGFGAKVGVFNSGGTIFGDDNAGKTFVGRVEYALGQGSTYQTWSPEHTGVSFGVGGGGFYTMDVATSTAAAGGDAMLRAGGLAVLVDGAWSMVTPTNSDVATPDVYDGTTRVGVTGQISYGIKSFEPAVRASWFSDADIGSWTQLFAGVVWHGRVMGHDDMVRVGAGYEMRLESGAAIPNDTARLWTQFYLPGEGHKGGGMGGKGGMGGMGGGKGGGG